MTSPRTVVTSQATTVGVSPKAAAATAVVSVLSVVIGLLNGLSAHPDLLGTLPAWAQVLIVIAVPPVLTAFVTYRASVGTVALPPVVEVPLTNPQAPLG